MCFIAEHDWTPSMEKEKKRRGAMHVKAGASRELLSYKVSPWKREEAGGLSHLGTPEGTRSGKHLEFRF